VQWRFTERFNPRDQYITRLVYPKVYNSPSPGFFTHIDGQAETIHDSILKKDAFQGIFQVSYGLDPCDPTGPP